jgi:cell division protein FtsL
MLRQRGDWTFHSKSKATEGGKKNKEEYDVIEQAPVPPHKEHTSKVDQLTNEKKMFMMTMQVTVLTMC